MTNSRVPVPEIMPDCAVCDGDTVAEYLTIVQPKIGTYVAGPAFCARHVQLGVPQLCVNNVTVVVRLVSQQKATRPKNASDRWYEVQENIAELQGMEWLGEDVMRDLRHLQQQVDKVQRRTEHSDGE